MLGKQFIKKIARFVFGDYAIYHIYARDKKCVGAVQGDQDGFCFALLEKAEIESSDEKWIRDQREYHGDDSHTYACLQQGRVVGLCCFWFGERYRRQRNFWPLTDGEAKLVQIITSPEMRGRGVASALIGYAETDMSQKGFHRLYARIWHSNTPSLKAFERAGWRRVATVTEVYPLRRTVPYRITLRAGGNA